MISILMSTHNRGQIINKTIDSIINQKYKNWEFIICDDASTDYTLKHLKEFAQKDSRIKLLINKKNLGLQKSLNECLKVSKGRYIARIDDDDIALPQRLSIQLDFLQKNPNILFVGSNIYFFEDNKIYGQQIYPKYPSRFQLLKRDTFSHPTIMIKSNILKEIGGYSESKKHYRVEDYELWLRLYYLGYRGANIQQKLLYYKKDINSVYRIKFIDRFNCFRLLLTYKNRLNIGFKGNFYVLLPLIKFLIPGFIRKKINYIKYSK